MTDAPDSSALSGWVIGVTGGIACGKSSVGAILSRHGVPVLDTDVVGHQVFTQSPGFERVVDAFGPDILDDSGQISREKLGKIVFANSEKRAHLNSIVHPLIRIEWQTWITARRADNDLAAVLVPLLFESNLEHEWDRVLVIAANASQIWQRMKSRNLTDVEITQRLNSQWPLEEKIERADDVIYNNGTFSDLEQSTLNYLNALKTQRVQS